MNLYKIKYREMDDLEGDDTLEEIAYLAAESLSDIDNLPCREEDIISIEMLGKVILPRGCYG